MTMHLTVAEAATVLGCSPRAVRARLSRGELKGVKQDGQWRIPRGDLPLSEDQHRALQARADTIRAMVEEVLPPQLAHRRGDQRRSFADLAAFRAGRSALAELRTLATAEAPMAGVMAAADHLERGLVLLGRAWPVFDGGARLARLDEARAEIGAAIAVLLLPNPASTSAAARCALALEEAVLPPLAGMCRAAERRGDDDRRRPR